MSFHRQHLYYYYYYRNAYKMSFFSTYLLACFSYMRLLTLSPTVYGFPLFLFLFSLANCQSVWLVTVASTLHFNSAIYSERERNRTNLSNILITYRHEKELLSVDRGQNLLSMQTASEKDRLSSFWKRIRVQLTAFPGPLHTWVYCCHPSPTSWLTTAGLPLLQPLLIILMQDQVLSCPKTIQEYSVCLVHFSAVASTNSWTRQFTLFGLGW